MKFDPITKKESEEGGLLSPSYYDAECIDAEELTDKNSQPMLKLTWKVFGTNGSTPYVYDYVSRYWMEFKLTHLAMSVNAWDGEGELTQFEPGDVKGKTAMVRVGVEAATPDYPAKNKVLDYLSAKPEPVTSPGGDDDNLPF